MASASATRVLALFLLLALVTANVVHAAAENGDQMIISHLVLSCHLSCIAIPEEELLQQCLVCGDSIRLQCQLRFSCLECKPADCMCIFHHTTWLTCRQPDVYVRPRTQTLEAHKLLHDAVASLS